LKPLHYILFFIALHSVTIVSAQNNSINNKPNAKVKKEKTVVDSIFVVDNKKFSYYNNWFTIGGGVQQNLTYKRTLGFAGGADYHYHIKKQYFQTGVMLSGERFGYFDNYQIHMGYGKRFEDKDVHVSAFAGVSYSTGFAKVGDTAYTRPFDFPGLYMQAEVIKKITYDVGLGLAFTLDWNKEQTIFGGRCVLYFSGAYKGKKYFDGKED
jgi:hypothetical protein